jgi:hypothetical protein
MASFGFAYKYKDTLLNRTLVFYGLAIFAIFDRLINETFFLENKLFKILITLLASIFIGLCVKNFTNFYRSALFVGAIFAGTLTLLQFTSKLEFIYTFLFITTCLAMIYSISKEPAEKFLLKIIVGLFLLIKIPIILNSSIVKPILERQLIHQFSFYTSFDVVALLTALLLCYYIYQQKIGKQKTAESNILSKKDFVLFLLPHLALLSGLIGRLLLHNPIRNELGKFSLLLLGINLLLSCITPIKSEYKPYILYISLISLSVLVFEPAQIFLFSSVVFFQVWVSYNSSFINNEIILMVLYLVFSFVVYFSSYGNISLSSFFEEGRYPILGGQITDYSYWNLTIIISFLVSKLVLVESIGLLFLRNICNKLDYTVRLLVGVFSITILILLGLAWYRYSPGNQQFLANISSTLLFIGIKTVIFTLGLLLTNLFGVKTEVQETQKGISMQEANLIA